VTPSGGRHNTGSNALAHPSVGEFMENFQLIPRQ
jgi:hypothetical protein